ncbi:MAG: hypothetical protein JST85_20970 [Acidobacteria bacterium]|nr:hypothetical protein [Acidobacteriota bacterium]
MRRHYSIAKLCLALSALLLAVSLTPFCFAQNPAPTPQIYQVTVTQVKPGMMDQYREFLKNETLAAFKKAEGKEFQTWLVQTLGEGGEVWTYRPIANLEALDEPNFLIKALGETGVKTWNAKRAQLVSHTRSFLISTVPALTVPPKGEAKICIGVRATITPGRVAEYMKWLKENALPAAAKTDAKGIYTNSVGLGGNPNEVQVAVLFDNFKDMGNFVAAYGKAMADLKLQTNAPVGVVAQTEFAVYRFAPELSLLPAPAKTASR